MAVPDIVRVLGTRTNAPGENRFQGFTRVYATFSSGGNFIIAAGSTDAASGGFSDGQGIYPDFSNVPADGSSVIAPIYFHSGGFSDTIVFDLLPGATGILSIINPFMKHDMENNNIKARNWQPPAVTATGDINLSYTIAANNTGTLIFDILHP